MTRSLWLVCFLILMGCLMACLMGCPRGPARTTFARYPGAPAERDASKSDPRALAIADRVFVTAGGRGNWERAKEVSWTQTLVAAESRARPPSIKRSVGRLVITPDPTDPQDHMWDRWNGRYAVRTHHRGLDTVFILDVYGSDIRGFAEPTEGERRQAYPLEIVAGGNSGPRATWHADTVLMCLPFLLREPGAELAYLGPTHNEDGDFDRLRLTFADADKLRSVGAVEFVVNKADLVVRASVEGGAGAGTFDLKDWVTVGGLSIPTTRIDLSTSEIMRMTNVKVSETVEDDDFTWSSGGDR